MKVLKVGDQVRVQLDVPMDINQNKLHGRFRSSDIRWDPIVRTIKRMSIVPGQPIMYMLDGDNSTDGVGDVAYTYNQLQKVSSRENVEVNPVIDVEENRFEVKDIIDKKTENGVIKYLVHWKNERRNQATWEKRETLLQDLGDAYMNRVDKKLDNKQVSSSLSMKNDDNDDNDDNNEEVKYEVENILDRKKVKNKIMYLVKWKGYSEAQSTYEPRANLVADLGKQYLDDVDARLNKKK